MDNHLPLHLHLHLPGIPLHDDNVIAFLTFNRQEHLFETLEEMERPRHLKSVGSRLRKICSEEFHCGQFEWFTNVDPRLKVIYFSTDPILQARGWDMPHVIRAPVAIPSERTGRSVRKLFLDDIRAFRTHLTGVILYKVEPLVVPPPEVQPLVPPPPEVQPVPPLKRKLENEEDFDAMDVEDPHEETPNNKRIKSLEVKW